MCAASELETVDGKKSQGDRFRLNVRKSLSQLDPCHMDGLSLFVNGRNKGSKKEKGGERNIYIGARHVFYTDLCSCFTAMNIADVGLSVWSLGTNTKGRD